MNINSYKRKNHVVPRLLMADAYTIGSNEFESDKATVIASAESLAPGDLLCTRLHIGTVISEVKNIEI